MAQHDYIIDNGSGSAVRADINTLLQAVVSQNSDDTEPSTKYAFQLWADTSANQLKLRNSGNTGWDIVGALDTQNLGLMLASVFPNINDTVNTSDEELNKLYLATSTASANKVVITDANKDINLGTGDFRGTKVVVSNDIVTSGGQFGNNTTDPKAEIDLGDTLTGFPSVMSRNKGTTELDYAVPDGEHMQFGHHSGVSGGGTTRLTLESDGDLTLHGSGKFRGDGSALSGITASGIKVYTTVGSVTWNWANAGSPSKVNVILVGGGGGGSKAYGGEGGSGQTEPDRGDMIGLTTVNVSANVTVTVGDAGCKECTGTGNIDGGDGGDSKFGSLTADGGKKGTRADSGADGTRYWEQAMLPTNSGNAGLNAHDDGTSSSYGSSAGKKGCVIVMW
jgi:hypothetical protein